MRPTRLPRGWRAPAAPLGAFFARVQDRAPRTAGARYVGLGIALVILTATGTACDPSQFDARRKASKAPPGLDAATDGGHAVMPDAGPPTSQRDADTRATDARATDAPDANVGDASQSVDGSAGGQPDAATCIAPHPGQGPALAVVPGSARVIARVPNPDGVVAREVVAIKPLGNKLLWTLMISPAASPAQADGGVEPPSSYASVAHTPLSGPWNTPRAASAAPSNLVLEEHLGPGGLPTPLIPLDLQPSVGNELFHVGLVVSASTATLYLKQYYIYASVAIFVGSLKAGDFALQAKPTELFRADRNQPLLGTGAFARMDEVYAFGCQYDANNQSSYPCSIGRASIQTLDDSSSYETYRGSPPAQQGWTHMLDRSTPLFSGAERITLSFNKHLGQWLAVTSAGGDTNEGVAYLRTAPLPEGPWSDPLAVPLPRSPGGLTVFFAAEHPELAQNCGQRLVLSYLEPSAMYVFGQQLVGNIALTTLDLQ